MIRNFILRQMSINRYGMFQFLKKQVSEHQKQYQELQSQYKNTQDIYQQIEIMKSIINIRHSIDEQDIVSIDTLDSYYKFINDYQIGLRKRLKINKETTDLYKQVFQKFIDQTIFDKVQENSLFSLNIIDRKFLQFNSLIYLFDEKYESKQYEQISDIIKKIISTARELSLFTDGINNYKVQILTSLKIGFFMFITSQFNEAIVALTEGLKIIQILKQNQENHQTEFSQSDKEWLFDNEGQYLKILVHIYKHLNQGERCIEYQDKTLQLIKDYEGISLDYVYTLYQFNNEFGEFNNFRQLKIIEETCNNIEKGEGYLLLQFQRIQILFQLDQLNVKEYDRIIRLHKEIQIIDDFFQTAFYNSILICGIRLKCYSDINKHIDLMFSHISTLTHVYVELLVLQRKSLYDEFLNKKLNHNKNVYEKTMLYFQQKTYPLFAEIQRQFAENYFNQGVERQKELIEQMQEILKDYLNRSIYGNDHNLIRVALEKQFKLFLHNPNYRETIMTLFQKFNQTANLPPQIKTQLSKYIKELEQKR